MSTELMTELLEAGVHFGHQTKRWNPKMKPYIFEKRNAIYLIDLAKTVGQLETATRFLNDTASGGGKILFVGCKKQAQEAIKVCAAWHRAPVARRPTRAIGATDLRKRARKNRARSDCWKTVQVRGNDCIFSGG